MEGLFLASTYGSHHISLINVIAALHNHILESRIPFNTGLGHLSELPNIQSGKSFGLAASDHMLAFGRLIDIKEEPTELDGITAICSPDSMYKDAMDLMVQARCSVLKELNIDPALLNKAAVAGTASTENMATTTKSKLESESVPTVRHNSVGANTTVIVTTTTK